MPDAEHLPDIPVVSPNSTRKLPWPSLLYLIFINPMYVQYMNTLKHSHLSKTVVQAINISCTALIRV